MRSILLLSHLALYLPLAVAQTVEIQVDANAKLGPWRPMWAYFGYDEPNYTYMKNGKKLIGELGAIGDHPVHIRAHNLLTTGDGTAALKWGSTNAYTEDASGKPVYDWKIVDRIFDTYLEAHAKPFVEIGFTPEAMSVKPQPYQHKFPDGSVFTGWSYPPKDMAKWGELVRRLAEHCAERYGSEEASSWYWEVWNEPDIGYWHGTPQQYNQLYDVSVAAVRKVLPKARVGGPASTGPASAKAAAFLKQFLEHCAKVNCPLDFISYHAKGQPKVVDGHVQMGLSKNLEDVRRGLEIMNEFPQYKNLPVILSECDPEGCAACSARTKPANAYRNGPLYAAYSAAAYRNILDLGQNVEGLLTWAFTFEDQPPFEGFRELATYGIDKPVMNFFRMAGQLHGERVAVTSTAGLPVETIIADGVPGAAPYIDGMAARGEREVSVILWNYHDDDIEGPDAAVRLMLKGIPAGRLRVTHYRIDQKHSNAYTVWKAMGSPAAPNRRQLARLEAAGQLQLLESPKWVDRPELTLTLPRQGVSLVQVAW